MPIQVSWRLAAIYCNWLQHGKSANWQTIQTGAYDAGTFRDVTTTTGGFLGYTDQMTRSPGAQFWIPSLDEWLKAVHYDPNKLGNGQGGWWDQPGGSNDELIAGPPGIGQTSAGWENPYTYFLPVDSYANVTTPWGLFDASGGLAEWTEEDRINPFTGTREARLAAGSFGPGDGYSRLFDDAGFDGYGWPFDPWAGLRIATSVPSPSSLIAVVVGGGQLLRRRRS